MAFSKFTVNRPTKRGGAITCGIKKYGDHFELEFNIRAEVSSQAGWADGDLLTVYLGDGEHHGIIRLEKTKDGSATLRQRTGGAASHQTKYLNVSLGPVPQFVQRAETMTWVQFTHQAPGCVMITLPEWSKETATVVSSRRAGL